MLSLCHEQRKEDGEGEWNEMATAGEGTASLQCIYMSGKFMLDAVIPAILGSSKPLPVACSGLLLCPV